MAARLEELAERARAAGRIAIDAEFVSESRYRPLLCLVQLAVDDGQELVVEVVDALASIDPSPLAGPLADPDVEVVVHAGRHDVALLRRNWGVEVSNVFDTQVAGAFVGYGIQTSYETLLSSVLHLRVSKSASFTRWDRRPISPEQLAYAREDVEHLLELAAVLQRRLDERGRVAWAREESRRVEESTDQRDPETVFRGLPKLAGLDGRAAAIARELVHWRERRAEQDNKPPAWFLNDPALVEVARRRPPDGRRLADIRGMKEVSVRRHGREILEVVRRGESAPPVRVERPKPPPKPAGALVALADALVRARADEHELAHQLIVGKAELTELASAIVRGAREPDVPVLTGWRRELVGEELVELLRGRRAVSVDEGGGLRVDPRP